MTTLVDILIDQRNRNQKYFANYREYASIIKELVSGKLKAARVLVFGSVVNGTWRPNRSDIDILVISKDVSRSAAWQSELRVQILRKIGDLSAPFEIHFATPEIYQDWYSKFIKNSFEV